MAVPQKGDLLNLQPGRFTARRRFNETDLLIVYSHRNGYWFGDKDRDNNRRYQITGRRAGDHAPEILSDVSENHIAGGIFSVYRFALRQKFVSCAVKTGIGHYGMQNTERIDGASCGEHALSVRLRQSRRSGGRQPQTSGVARCFENLGRPNDRKRQRQPGSGGDSGGDSRSYRHRRSRHPRNDRPATPRNRRIRRPTDSRIRSRHRERFARNDDVPTGRTVGGGRDAFGRICYRIRRRVPGRIRHRISGRVQRRIGYGGKTHGQRIRYVFGLRLRHGRER